MFNKLSQLIMEHLTYIDYLKMLCTKLLAAAKKNNYDLVSHETANKDRIINIIAFFHDQINDLIKDHTDYAPLDRDIKEIIKIWSIDLEIALADISKLDQLVLEYLNQEKIKTKKDLASLFLNRTKFGGYNLSNVKK